MKNSNCGNKIVLFGGSGMLGYDFIRHLKLVARETSVVFPSHKEVDMGNSSKVFRYLSSMRMLGYDTVVNCAAATDVSGIQSCVCSETNSYLMNALAPRYVAEACASLGMRLVHMSTDYVYSEMSLKTVPKRDEFPMNIYGYHKLIGELFVKESMGKCSAPYSIIRVGCLYGMHREKSFVHKFLKNVAHSIKNGDFSPSVVDWQTSTPTSTRFVCDMILNVLDSGMFGTTMTASPIGSATRFEFAKKIVEFAAVSGYFPKEMNKVVVQRNSEVPNYFIPRTSCMEELNLSIPHVGYGYCWTWKDDLGRFFDENSKELSGWFNAYLESQDYRGQGLQEK